ncbi:MAG TPA: VOC family protein, partial [Bdellovibrio sp.]|nr:VOC family protein [Bdellovibrio sp.]
AYLLMQEKVQTLYREHAEVDFSYLKDSQNPLLRTEVIKFFDTNSSEVIKKIDSDPRVLQLFDQFTKEIWDDSVPIQEEIFEEEPLSNSGKINHIEIYCSNLEKSADFWQWFLNELGYKPYQKWSSGVSFKLGASYIVFVQTEEKFLKNDFHRCRPGLNHLAFHASSPSHVDELTKKLKDRGLAILYSDKHPHAAGLNSYGVFFEDPERIKVEVMALPFSH